MTSIIRRRSILAALVLALASASVQAGETRLAVGALTFAPGLDLHLTWRAEESHWQFGLRAVRYSDEFQFYGESLTETTTTMTASGEDSAVAPFFGAGYTGRLGRTGFYNIGLFVSPVELTTQTADSLTTGNGADVQLQLGMAF
jgi:hypothetical protein